MITVKRYSVADEKIWNAFIDTSANATFILDRRFLEYHKDRFLDHSLLFYIGEKLIALFPANENRKNIYSHGGLTYGGLIVSPKMSLQAILSCFYSLTKYYHDNKFRHITYKPVPTFFPTTPSNQDQYALFLLHAKLTAMNTGFVIDVREKLSISKQHLRQMQKAQNNNVIIMRDRDCSEFWDEMLIPHLANRFHTKPIHTLAEITLLQKRFPKQIIQYVARIDGKPTAGSTIFFDRGVAHTQYIANNELGRKTGSLDYLFCHLLMHEYKNIRYFSFGTTNKGSPDGRALSLGLAWWKEKFGAFMVPYPCYDIETKNYTALKEYRNG